MSAPVLSIVDANISDLQHALSSGSVTCVELVASYLNRIATYDANGLNLSAVPIINPAAIEEAAASDAYRAAGLPVRALEGIPYLIKDSIKVKGMSLACGSPAFESLVANQDAACIENLRNAGAVIIGRTNMPPMADGGMQRGLYGRAESPYNPKYLTAAYASGSSNGSATATTASFGAFGLGTETVSSGRSPASNNAIVAYTPSRGLLSLRGVWPLYPTCDVLVPHTRTMSDLLTILDVVAVPDKTPTGDFWNEQSIVELPKIEKLRPKSFKELQDPGSLRGKRFGVPTMYIGGDNPLPTKTETRPSVINLWERARKALEACGATVIELDFPMIEVYEARAHTGEFINVKNMPKEWPATERGVLVAHVWDDFLRENAQPEFPSLSSVDPDCIFPLMTGTLAGAVESFDNMTWAEMVNYPKTRTKSIFDVPGISEAVSALEDSRKETFEQWMDKNRLDAVIFPANGDVGPANGDIDKEGSILAWRNGVKYSNGNRPIRHLGVPTVSVPMGIMDDIKMPVNLTIATRAYDDVNLLRYGYAFEAATKYRIVPPLTPPTESDLIPLIAKAPLWNRPKGGLPKLIIDRQDKTTDDFKVSLCLEGHLEVNDNSELATVVIYVNGKRYDTFINNFRWHLTTEYEASSRDEPWVKRTSLALSQTIIIIVARTETNLTAGKLLLL
jgi:Asp-tRNA(Asn)/Glu-tRNA(Gln) amidotransferase A subunit family amidase